MKFNHSFWLINIWGIAVFIFWGINPQKLGANIAHNSTTNNNILVKQEELVTANILRNLEEKFKKAQEKTELLDDGTEKILYRHKNWFLLFLILFIIIAYKSLTLDNK